MKLFPKLSYFQKKSIKICFVKRQFQFNFEVVINLELIFKKLIFYFPKNPYTTRPQITKKIFPHRKFDGHFRAQIFHMHAYLGVS